jgi:hypothetical protein
MLAVRFATDRHNGVTLIEGGQLGKQPAILTSSGSRIVEKPIVAKWTDGGASDVFGEFPPLLYRFLSIGMMIKNPRRTNRGA